MPGIEVVTTTRVGPSAPTLAASGQFFVAGIAERGDSALPILLRSTADMERYLGTRQSFAATLWDTLKVFFDEGGSQAYVARVVGPAASVGTLTLQDRAGSPVNTIRVDAANPGAWSSTVTVQVQNGSIPNSYRVTVRLSGTIVEDVNNLLTPVAGVNAFAKSPYIRMTDLASATAAPNNIPAAIAATALSAGADDRAAVNEAALVTALSRFTYDLGDGAVAIPGYNSTGTIWPGINTHCQANRRVGLLAFPRNTAKATLLSSAAVVDTLWCGAFAPWVRITDGVGGYIAVPPEGYVAAARARAHESTGPWRVPAGAPSAARTLLDVDDAFTVQDAKDLDDGHVSVVRKITNQVRLYGWRSLSSNTVDYAYLKDRDVLNWFVTKSENALEDYVFATVDARGHLLSQINAAIVGVADPVRVAGGLYELFDSTGRQVDPGYRVTTDQTVNPPSSLATNVINVVLEVRLSPSAGLIRLTIVKVGLLSGLS